MLIVTGGIACGKSTFLDIARKLGYNCVDADEWHHSFRNNPVDAYTKKELFGDNFDMGEVAFVHPQWKEYEDFVGTSFKLWIDQEVLYHGRKIDILIIPDFFNKPVRTGLLGIPVLTIERPNNVLHAMKRDSHRDVDFTMKIHRNQMTPDERCKRADFVIINRGTKEEFQEECEKWLKSHLPAVSTRPM